MRKRYAVIAMVLAVSSAVSIGFAVTPPPATAVGTTSLAVALPTAPPPLPPLVLPARSVFRPALTAANADDNGLGTFGKGGLGVSQGLIGVFLDGDDSTASILDNTGIVNVDLRDKTYHGHHVRSITMDSVTIDDGTIIHRGIATGNGTGVTVPAIVGNPYGSPTPLLFGSPAPPFPTTQPIGQGANVPQGPLITPEPNPADTTRTQLFPGATPQPPRSQ
jgi:hypothetical protein